MLVASAITTRKHSSIRRLLRAVSSSTRGSTATTTGAITPDASSVGTVSGLITNIEPNRIVNDAPVVLLVWVPR
jgi:hypothetical protein